MNLALPARLFSSAALVFAFLGAGCSGQSPSDGSTSEDGGERDATVPRVTVSGARESDAAPYSSGFAYYVPSPPGTDFSQTLTIVFTTLRGAVCGSSTAIALANQSTVAGADAIVLSVAVTSGEIEAGTYPWENYGGQAWASSESAMANCSATAGGISGGELALETLTATMVAGSFRLDVDRPATTGTFAVPLCGKLPAMTNGFDMCVQP